MTRRDKRRRLAVWLSELFCSRPGQVSRSRAILVEPLESRQLLAGDGFMALLGSSYQDVGLQGLGGSSFTADTFSGAGQVSVQGELSAEGEDADDLVAFAKALTDSGTRFFGAAWCTFCTQQKELFQDGGKYLPYIEVTNPDRTPNQIALDEGIEQYPTWEFPDGSRLTGVQSLQTLSQRAVVAIPQSSIPSMQDLGNISVGIGSPLHIPIDAYDPNGDPLTITVTSSDPSLLNAQVLSNNRSLRLSIQQYGDMVFELFEDRAPVPAGRVIQLAQDGFYDGVIFHRVINNFVIQGGDPTGTGSGGSTLGQFDDQYHLDLQHNRTGVLSFAKSTDDTNDSQFFITEGPQRFLDFNHSVFGQLIEGEAVREAISNTATNASDRPVNPVVISSATVFEDTQNGLLMLKPTGAGTGTATITVTVSDTQGNSTSQSFQATVVPDTANGAPFLNPIPPVETELNTPVTIQLSAQDKENDPLIFSVQKLGTQDYTVTVDSNTGVVTLTPPTGFTGELEFRATVRQTTAPTTSSPDDNQVVRVLVTPAGTVTAPTAIDLLAESDSGISSTDNITNAQTLVFAVSGTNVGAIVEVLAGDQVVGTATASGTVTNVTVDNVASLGQGSTLFAARQRVGGQTSPPSAGLSVTLDSEAPVGLAAGAIPSSAILDQTLSVDLNHPEEGQGLLYSLSVAPVGMVIDGSTGLLTWTPSGSQVGVQSLTLTLTDAAGNSRDQQFSISVVDQPQVRISLNAVDLNGLPITTVATGQQFKVQVVVSDLRGGSDATGVFAAYLDLLFDSSVIEPVASNPIVHIDPYLNDRSGSTLTPGLIDELGAFSDRSSRLGSDSRVLAEVTFLAKAAGNPGLRTEAPDRLGNDILLYDLTSAVPFSRVEFGSSSFVVGADFIVVDDVFNFDEDSGVHALNVLANDSVTGSAQLTIVEVGIPNGGGTVTIAADGKSLNYSSAENFNGAESFTYTAQNQAGVRLTATVTVQVADVNDPPVALNDTFAVARNSTQNVLDVLANDHTGVDDPNAETLFVSAVSSGSAGGTIQVGPSGLTVRYTPAAGFQGTETFTYTLSDSRGGTDTGTVTVSVIPESPPPIPQDDNFTVEEDADLAAFDVLANDTASDPSKTLSIAGVGSSAVGSFVAVSDDGLELFYRPFPDFNGTEVISYTLRDSVGATATGRVTFTVTPVNDPPDARDDTFSLLSGNAVAILDVLANDENVDDGETLTIIAVTQPPAGSGSVAISSDGFSLIYTSPGAGFQGDFSFTYTIDDGTGLTDTATVTLNVRDFVPRDVSGKVLYGSGDGAIGLNNFALILSGTDVTGADVSRQTTVATDGSYMFTQLAPGNYMLQRPPLPFLNDTGSLIPIQSNASDGNFVSNLLVTGSLKAGLFGIRDFLGTTVKSNLTVALNADGTTNWMAARGDWSTFDTLQVNLNSSGDALQVSAASNGGQSVQATLPINGSVGVSQIAQESSMRLLRVRTAANAVGITTPAATASAATLATFNTGLLGEGEGGEDLSLAPLAAMAPAVSPQRNPIVAANAAPLASASAANLTPPLSPSQAISQLLGSATQGRQSGPVSRLSASSVDQAMESLLPSLQVELSDNLQDALASDASRTAVVVDSIIAGL